jgi:hypothetical protein
MKDGEPGEVSKIASRQTFTLVQAMISLGAGGVLTFTLPGLLDAVWPYLRDEHFQPYPGVVTLNRLLNLPAVIYCAFFKLPEGLQRGDESLYCWSVGLFFNIPYYATVFFALWRLIGKARRKLAEGAQC